MVPAEPSYQLCLGRGLHWVCLLGGRDVLQDLSLSWLGSVSGPFPFPAGAGCMAPSGSSSVPLHNVWWASGARSQIKQSRFGRTKCSLAGGQGEGAFGSSGETAGFCKALIGVRKVGLRGGTEQSQGTGFFLVDCQHH